MKQRSVNNLVGGMIMAAMTGVMLATVFGLDPIMCSLAVLAASVMLGFATRNQTKVNGIATVGLLKEVWESELIGRLWDDDSFLEDGKDAQNAVENDALNTQMIGAKPGVARNRTVWPVPMTPRTDLPFRLPLSDFSTEATVIRSVEEIALSYDKRASVINDHKMVLQEKISEDGLFDIAPTTNTTATPVVKTTGALNVITGKKMLSQADLYNLARVCDDAKWPKKGRVLVVNPTMFWDFVGTSTVLQNQLQHNGRAGTATEEWVFFAGFTIRNRATVPYYNHTTLTKIAYGAAPTASDSPAGVVYVAKQSWAKGKGTAEMFFTPKDAREQGDIVSFRARAIILPYSQRLLAAIVGAP